MIPEYLPGGKHTSSSIGAFVNYFGPKPDPKMVLSECEAKHGVGMVIVDGSDDWHSPASTRPQVWVPKDMIVAYYHSGISGITRSGVVLRASDYDSLRRIHAEKYGDNAWSKMREYRLNSNNIEHKEGGQ